MYGATAPNIMAAFPAISRSILRGDITESKKVAPLNVHYDSLNEFKHSFADKTERQYDIKSFTTDKVPNEVLAVAKTEIRYVKKFTDTPKFH